MRPVRRKHPTGPGEQLGAAEVAGSGRGGVRVGKDMGCRQNRV